MASLYYIKRADTTDIVEEGRMLMDEIYDCCINGNPENRQIFTSGSSGHITPHIEFKPYDKSHKETYDMVREMDCGELGNQYLWSGFQSYEYCTLIEFQDHSHTKIKTILSFSFNEENKCIEINSFCCSPRGGGGNIFNFVLNAVKCGIYNCMLNGQEYLPKIILTCLPGAERFYEKFGFRTLQLPVFEIALDEEPKKTKQTRDVVVIQALVDLDKRSIDEALNQITDRSNPYYNLRESVRLRYPREEYERNMEEASIQDSTVKDPTYTPSLIQSTRGRPKEKDKEPKRRYSRSRGGTVKKNKKQKRHTTKYKKRKSRK